MVRVRFAPSPTGYMHIGGMRTALYNYLFAKKNGGTFILRIEDTDLERFVEGAKEGIYDALTKAGLIYDEGPNVGGEFAPYVQSERKQLYLKCAQELVERGGAYYCFCDKKRLEQLHQDGATKYDKKCASLPKDEVEQRIKRGESYVIRQNIPQNGVSEFEDLIYGSISIDYNDLEDGVLIKSDGMPTYNFANVVDDHYMNITHIIRGVEFLSSTPKYNLIYDFMGWQRPQYAHLQPIMKNEREKLSKRKGDPGFEDFLEKGFLTPAIINYIALLGWSPKDETEKMSLSQMIERFSLEGVSRSPSIFDLNKLRWLNSLYMRELSLEQFHSQALPRYNELEYLKGLDLEKLSALLASRVEVFSDIESHVRFLNEFENYDLTLFDNQKNKTTRQSAVPILQKLVDHLQSLESFEGLYDNLTEFAAQNEIKKGAMFWVFRIAIAGALVTPGGATELAFLLGKKTTMLRLKESLKRLQE